MLQIVGIDVSKSKLDCVWLKDPSTLKGKSKVVENSKPGIEGLANWLTSTIGLTSDGILVIMEATGIYHESLAYTLFNQGFKVAVINPAQIKAYSKSLGNTHKTDRQDSWVIARYGATQSPGLWTPEPPEIRELKALVARLEALDKDCQREHNRLEKAQTSGTTPIVLQSIRTMIEQLSQEKKRLERQIDDHIDRHPHLKKDRQLLTSIPGIGPTLSRLMLSVIHSRPFKNAEQLAAFLGVIPKLVESGVFKGRSALSKKGPPSVRAKLYMAAIVASRHNPDVIKQKSRLLAKGKTKMQALGAAMRKLVHICFGVIKNQTEYSPQAS
jgi:transposase